MEQECNKREGKLEYIKGNLTPEKIEVIIKMLNGLVAMRETVNKLPEAKELLIACEAGLNDEGWELQHSIDLLTKALKLCEVK